MADLRCPMCGKSNPPDLDECQYCQARLKPLQAQPQDAGSTMQPGEESASRASGDMEDSMPDWLSSLRSTDEDDSASAPAASEEAVPDWLSGLRGHSEGGRGVQYKASGADEEPEDWLRDILPVDASGEDAGEPDLSASSDDESDWLRRIGADAESAGGQPYTDTPEWLSDLEDSSPEIEQASVPEWFTQEAEHQAAPESAVPDWLSEEGEERLDWLEQGASEPPVQSAADELGLPDWLSQPPAEEPDGWVAQPADEGDEGIPDWLSGELEAEQPALSVDKSDMDLPDWLSQPPVDQSAPAAAQPADEGEAGLPDWLMQETPEPDVPPVAQPVGDEGIPDWLSGEGEPRFDWLSQEPEEQSSAAQPADEEAGLPDWMSGAEGEGLDWLAQEPEEQAAAAQPAAEEASLPDWMSGAEDEGLDWLAQEPEEQAAAAQPEGEEAGLPDWISGAEDEGLDWLAQEPEEQAAAVQPAGEGEGLPDWMLGVEDETPDWLPPGFTGKAAQSEAQPAGEDGELDWLAQEAEEQIAGAQPAIEADLPDWLSGDELPDWLAEEGMMDAIAPEETAGGLGAGLEQAEEDLEWLGELEAAFPDMPSDAQVSLGLTAAEPSEDRAGIESTFGDALPGWLSEMESEPETGEPGAVKPLESEEDLGIMPAELPSWLEAMRPVTAVEAAAQMDAQIAKGELVSAGPLVGLRGVLPAEPDAAHTTKPPIYSVRLQVSDLQKSHADLLGQLLEMEGEPRPIPSRPVITTQHVLRLVIAALLILTIFLSIVLDLSLVSVPPASNGLRDTQNLVAGVPDGSAVLVAIDYEPGLSGEMDAITGPVLDQLMRRGIFLTLVSTRPTGPLQAEHLLAQLTQLGAPEYVAPQQYVNLGYIPGGELGLRGFAQTPRQILPQAMTGGDVWVNSEAPALMSINSLADFAMLIVATENPDTARFWIEQVQPQINNKPLVMLVSAQAEPMVQPYYQAEPRQVQGLVSGLAAGVSYEGLNGQKGKASAYWSAFSVGMLVAGLLMAVGGLFNVLSARLRRSKESKEGET